MMSINFIAIPILLLLLINQVWTCCPQFEDDGYYCTSDLSGYYKCLYTDDSWCLETVEEVLCPKGTRCSCFVDHWCTGNTTLNGICKPYEKPALFEKSFSLSFHQLRDYVSLNPYWDPHYNETSSGFVVRDVENKKYFWNDGDESKLVLEEEEGKFLQYTWKESKPTFCQRREIGSLPDFYPITEAKDLFLYTRIYDEENTKQSNQQKWYFQVGRDSWMFDFYKRWWTVSYDAQSKRALPVKYHEVHIGDEMADYTIYTTIEWKINNKQIDSNSLRPPSYCA